MDFEKLTERLNIKLNQVRDNLSLGNPFSNLINSAVIGTGINTTDSTYSPNPNVEVNSLIALVLQFAQSKVGTLEVGNNSGAAIAEFQKTVGLSSGEAWCVSFAYWAVGQACKQEGIPNPLPRTGSTSEMRSWGIRNQIADGTPRVGDIFTIKSPISHTGIVTGVGPGDTIYTVEGNTTEPGKSWVQGVFNKTRHVSKYDIVYVHWSTKVGR